MTAHTLIPYIPYGAVLGTALATWLGTLIFTTIRWRRVLKYHMPDVAKEKIQGLEAENDRLRRDLQEVIDENEKAAVKIKGVRAALEVE